jgi:hypothetical protein
MFYSNKYKLLFIAIPKTGSISAQEPFFKYKKLLIKKQEKDIALYQLAIQEMEERTKA